MGSWKLKKKMPYWKFRIVYSRQICRDRFFGFHKKKQKGKEKVSISRRGYTKLGCATSIRGGMSIIYRIRRSKLKVVLVVEVGGNQKAISLWKGCRNFGILLLKVERVPFTRHNFRTHQYDTKYLNHIEKADSLSFPTV